MSEKINELKAGALLSYVNLALSSLIPFFYTPVMLRILGESEYGLYSLSSSVISYFSLISFGFGSTIVRYITVYRASKEKDKEEKLFGFFLILYSLIAFIVLVCGYCVSNNVDAIFNKGLTISEIQKMKILIRIMTFNSAISFPISVYSSIVMSHEKYIFRRLIDMISTVMVPLGNLIALYMGFASVGMAVSSTIIQFTMLPINIIYCKNKLNIHPRIGKIPFNLIKEMISFSLFIFLGTLVDMLFWSTDKIILGMLAGSTAVAIYNIGGTFNTMVTSLSTSISSVLTPRITTMVVEDASTEQFTDYFIKIGRLQFIIVALIISGFTVFGKQFIILWAGKKYLKSYWVAILTLFPLCVPLIQNTGLSIVIAKNKHQFRSIVYTVIAIINVIFTYLLVPSLGEVGAALCSGVSYLLGQGVIMNIYYYKVIGINIPLFWKNIIRMSIIPIIMILISLILLSYFTLIKWSYFFLAICIYSIIYIILMYKYSLNDFEKSQIKIAICRLK